MLERTAKRGSQKDPLLFLNPAALPLGASAFCTGKPAQNFAVSKPLDIQCYKYYNYYKPIRKEEQDMGKVIRINDKNIQYMEDIRELFAKVKFWENIYWDDNKIITMALTNLIIDFRKYHEEEKLNKAIDDFNQILG